MYLCVCFGSMFTVLVQRYSKLHSAEALIVVNWPMRVPMGFFTVTPSMIPMYLQSFPADTFW